MHSPRIGWAYFSLELHPTNEELTFKTIQARLLAYVNARIQNGEFSERALAKVVDVSQPQLHNVLKGTRRLHTPLADALLDCFGISVLDLFTASELYSKLEAIGEAMDPFSHLRENQPRFEAR